MIEQVGLPDDGRTALIRGDEKRKHCPLEPLLGGRHHRPLSCDIRQTAAALGKTLNGEHEIGRLRRIGSIRYGLGPAFGEKKTRIAALPSVNLSVEEVPAGLRIAQRRKVGVDASKTTCGTFVRARGLRT